MTEGKSPEIQTTNVTFYINVHVLCITPKHLPNCIWYTSSNLESSFIRTLKKITCKRVALHILMIFIFFFERLGKLHITCYYTSLVDKGQLISKAIYVLLTSPKKRTNNFFFVCFFTHHGKQIKFVRCFFGRIYSSPICLLKLTDL